MTKPITFAGREWPSQEACARGLNQPVANIARWRKEGWTDVPPAEKRKPNIKFVFMGRPWSTVIQCSRELGFDRKRLTSWVKAGLTEPPPRGWKPPESPDQIAARREELRRRGFDLLELGWTQKAVGAELGISKGMVERWFGGSGPPSRRRRKIDSQPIWVSGRDFAGPAEAAARFGWEAEGLVSALAAGLEVYRGEAIAMGDPEVERARLAARGEEAVEERETPWYHRG